MRAARMGDAHDAGDKYIFGDWLAAAERLRSKMPEAYGEYYQA